MIAGGAVSAANTADIQEVIDVIESFCVNPVDNFTAELCDDLEQLRNYVAAAAVSSVSSVIHSDNVKIYA